MILGRMQRMVEAVIPGATVLHAKTLVGGAACITTRVDIDYSDAREERLVVREIADYCFQLDPNFAQLQHELLTELRSSGLKAPRSFGFGAAGEDTPSGYIVLEFIEGEVDFGGQSTRNLAAAYAQQMAEIHSAMPQCMDRLQRQNFGPFRIQEPKSDIEAQVQDKLQSLKPEPSGPQVLVHGDLWPGNVIWSGDAVVGIIDWDNALLGDRLYDVACARLDLRLIAGANAEGEFTETYRHLTGADLSNLPMWDLRACLRLFRGLESWPAVFPEMGRPDLTKEVLFQIIEESAQRVLAILDR